MSTPKLVTCGRLESKVCVTGCILRHCCWRGNKQKQNELCCLLKAKSVGKRIASLPAIRWREGDPSFILRACLTSVLESTRVKFVKLF